MHPLRSREGDRECALAEYTNGKPRGAVTVFRQRDTLIVQPGISVMRWDALVALIPDRFVVTDAEGKVIRPTRGSHFIITTETFDPYHLVAEVSG